MDVRTLLICAVSLLTVYAVTLLLAHLRQWGADGAGWLAAAYSGVALAAGLSAASGYIPVWGSTVLAGSFVVLGHLLLRRAICQFVGVSVTPVALVVELGLLAGSAAALAYWTFIQPDASMRILTVSVIPALLATYSADLLLGREQEPDADLSERALGWVIAGLAVLLFLRTGVALRGGPGGGLFDAGYIQAVGLLASVVFATSILVAFLWGTGARRNIALHRVAQLDPLTGLLNRRGFDRVASMRVEEAARNGQEILLFYADLDDLKLINDAHGHEVGDRAICEAASVLRDILRASDCLARFGGDEFCALVPVRSAADGDVILRRLDQRVAGRNAQPDRDYTVGLTAAVLPLGSELTRPLREMIHEVDQRMYLAKRGRKESGREENGEATSVQARVSGSAATMSC